MRPGWKVYHTILWANFLLFMLGMSGFWKLNLSESKFQLVLFSIIWIISALLGQAELRRHPLPKRFWYIGILNLATEMVFFLCLYFTIITFKRAAAPQIVVEGLILVGSGIAFYVVDLMEKKARKQII